MVVRPEGLFSCTFSRPGPCKKPALWSAVRKSLKPLGCTVSRNDMVVGFSNMQFYTKWAAVKCLCTLKNCAAKNYYVVTKVLVKMVKIRYVMQGETQLELKLGAFPYPLFTISRLFNPIYNQNSFFNTASLDFIRSSKCCFRKTLHACGMELETDRHTFFSVCLQYAGVQVRFYWDAC